MENDQHFSPLPLENKNDLELQSWNMAKNEGSNKDDKNKHEIESLPQFSCQVCGELFKRHSHLSHHTASLHERKKPFLKVNVIFVAFLFQKNPAWIHMLE